MSFLKSITNIIQSFNHNSGFHTLFPSVRFPNKTLLDGDLTTNFEMEKKKIENELKSRKETMCETQYL